MKKRLCRKCSGEMVRMRNRWKCRACVRAYCRANAEKQKATMKAWYKAHPERWRQRARDWRLTNPALALRTSLRARAKKVGVPCTLSETDCLDLLVTAACACCHCAFGTEQEEKRSIDRRRPDLGYVPGNVAPLCVRCNRLKSDATPEELRLVLAYVEASWVSA